MSSFNSHRLNSVNETAPRCGSAAFLKACRKTARYLPTCKGIAPCFKTIKPNKSLGGATLVDLFEVSDVLVGKDLVKLRNVSWCMFPIIMRGDLLKVEPARAGEMEIGDIAVFRRWGRLYSHRVIDTKQINGEPFVFTRPDTSRGGDDGPIGDDDLLGKVSQIIRRGRPLSPEKRDFSRAEKFIHFFILSKDSMELRLRTLAGAWLSNIQSRRIFRVILFRLFKPLCSGMMFSLGIPTNPKVTARFFSYIRLEELGPDLIEKIESSPRWHIVANYRGRLIGYATALLRPEDCPYPGYWIEDFFIRNRYRAAKIGTELFKRLRDILAEVKIGRVYVSVRKDNEPGKSFFKSLGFKEKQEAEELRILELNL